MSQSFGKKFARKVALGGGAAVIAAGSLVAGVGAIEQPSSATPIVAQDQGKILPTEYAEVTFNAWLQGNAVDVVRHSDSRVAQLLLARVPGDNAWSQAPVCEGAAGSTYCTWSSADSQLTLRVGNDSVAAGEMHAVIGATFSVLPGNVAIWPFTTQEAADNTQASIDAGHSPWMTDAVAVAQFFVEAELGWTDAVVEPLIEPGMLRAYDSETGVAVDIATWQPSRQGPGGIWAVRVLTTAQDTAI